MNPGIDLPMKKSLASPGLHSYEAELVLPGELWNMQDHVGQKG